MQKKFFSKAQGTIEYLFLIGVLLAIILIVTMFFLGIFDSTVKQSQLAAVKYKQTASFQSISLSEAIVDSTGVALFVLKNNTDYHIRLIGYEVDKNQFELGEGILFNPLEKKTVYFSNIGECKGTNTCNYDEIIFKYTTLDSTQTLKSGATAFILEKGPKTPWKLEGAGTTMVCVAQGEVLDTCDVGTWVLDNLVPYTGATGNVDLGNNNISANCIELSDGNSYCSASDFPNLDHSVPYTGATGNVDLGNNNISANCIELSDGNSYCSASDFPYPDLSEYVSYVSNKSIDINNSISWGSTQSNLKNSYMNLPIRLNDWNTESYFFDMEFLPKYTSGTVTQWDVMNIQSKYMPTVLSCRTANTNSADCILVFVGRTPSTSGFYYNSIISDSSYIKNMVFRMKFWDINSNIAIGAIASGEISAILSTQYTNGQANGLGFLTQIDENGNGKWSYRCGFSSTIVNTGIDFNNNKWYVFRISGNQNYGYNEKASSFNFYIDENLVGSCNSPSTNIYYSFVGGWTENSFAGGLAGQDIMVVDYVYFEQNRFDYDDIHTNFSGGSSSN